MEDIWNYIVQDSTIRAVRFLSKIETSIKELQQYPERCPVVPESEYLGKEYRHQIVGKYRIIIRIEAQTVFIMRVIHSSRLLEF